MKNKPNVLFIMSDQHHADCIGIEGKRDVKTPNLDQLAKCGVRFSRAYCNNPICSPSRISFYTGQYPHTHGILGNDNFDFQGDTPDTIPMHFRKNGYKTALIGKSHMVKKWDKAGFEYIKYCDLCDADKNDVLSNHYFKYLVDNNVADLYEDGALPRDSQYQRDQCGIAKLPYEHSLECWTGREALSFLEEHDESYPFFMSLSFERPHPNWLIPAEFKDMYDPAQIKLPESAVDAFERGFLSKPPTLKNSFINRRKSPEQLKKILAAYYTLITIIDAEIGKVIKLLENRGLLENTIIVYTADHGDFAGDHGLYSKNLGIYESVHRIPFLIKYPQCPENAVVDEAIIESVDLYPSLCQLCGLELPEHLEGTSFMSVIEGNKSGKEYSIAEWDWTSPYKRINAIRTADFRLVFFGGKEGGELYHNGKDPGELNNLWNDPGYVEIKLQVLEKLFAEVMKFKPRTTMDDDKQNFEANKNTSTLLIHKQYKKWSDIKDRFYNN